MDWRSQTRHGRPGRGIAGGEGLLGSLLDWIVIKERSSFLASTHFITLPASGDGTVCCTKCSAADLPPATGRPLGCTRATELQRFATSAAHRRWRVGPC